MKALPKCIKCFRSAIVIIVVSAHNFQAEMTGNLSSLVIACSLLQLHLFICLVANGDIRVIIWIFNEQATIASLIKPCLVIVSSALLALTT